MTSEAGQEDPLPGTRSRPLERIVFCVSIALLGFLFGFGSSVFNWFPSSFLNGGLEVGARLLAPPRFTAPRVYDRHGATLVDRNRAQPGLTLVSKHWASFDWKPGLKLIDRAGRTLHEWPVDVQRLFPDSVIRRASFAGREVNERSVHGAHLYPDGSVVFNIGWVGTVKMDACGRVEWRLPARSHHLFDRARDGTFWIPGSTPEVRRGSAGYPDGHPGINEPVYHDRILHVDEDGDILAEFNVLDLLYDNGLERYIAKAGGRSSAEDVTHLNDLEALPDSLADEYPLFDAGDLLVSLRNLDMVFVFDPRTRNVKWHASEPFIEQHDADFMGGGWIGIFDNNTDGTARGTMLGGSRIVALEPHTRSQRIVFPTPDADPFYTPIMGNWERLENGNLLLVEGRAGRIVEVAPDGRTVWEWVGEPYSEERIAEIDLATRHQLTAEMVARWPCSTMEEERP